MKPKPGFDPDFPANSQRWCWPGRSIGLFMILVVVSGLAWAVRAEHSPRPARLVPIRFVRNDMVLGGPGQAPPAGTFVRQADQPFVLIAPLEIDQEMVVPALAGIDEAMVFHPDTGNVVPVRRDSPPAPMPIVPGDQPLPLPNGLSSPPAAPLPPMPAQPR